VKFEVITKQSSDINSENFKIHKSPDSNEDGQPVVVIENDDFEFEFSIVELDELIQGLILYREHNVERKKESTQTKEF